jgi:hypothetical protein
MADRRTWGLDDLAALPGNLCGRRSFVHRRREKRMHAQVAVALQHLDVETGFEVPGEQVWMRM